MIIGAEIALLFFGLWALFKGEYPLGKNKILHGKYARICGVVCLTPIPLAHAFSFVCGVYLGIKGVTPTQIKSQYHWHFVGIEAASIVLIVILLFILSKQFFKIQEALEVAEKNVGSKNPDVATSLENLALLYRATGRVEEAEKLEERAARIRAIKR